MTSIIKKRVVLSLSTMTLFSACKHQPNFSQLKTVSYSTEIAPIISSNCTYSGCHGDTNAVEFKLRNYKEVMRFGAIKEGYPEASNLYATLKSLKSNIVMPKPPYNKLSDTQIELIYIWIGQGALNN